MCLVRYRFPQSRSGITDVLSSVCAVTAHLTALGDTELPSRAGTLQRRSGPFEGSPALGACQESAPGVAASVCVPLGSDYAATTLIRPAFLERGLRRIT